MSYCTDSRAGADLDEAGWSAASSPATGGLPAVRLKSFPSMAKSSGGGPQECEQQQQLLSVRLGVERAAGDMDMAGAEYMGAGCLYVQEVTAGGQWLRGPPMQRLKAHAIPGGSGVDSQSGEGPAAA